MFARYVGRFEGIRVYETEKLGAGYNSGGLALPGVGIFVGSGTYSKKLGLEVVAHEFGHFLQFRAVGPFWYYLLVGPLSLLSAWTNWHGKGHQCYWVEQWANHLSAEYFGPRKWNQWRFPCEDISKRSKWWMGMAK